MLHLKRSSFCRPMDSNMNKIINAQDCLLNAGSIFNPFKYPWAYDAWYVQHKMAWLAEVTMFDDIYDWKVNLTNDERELLKSYE